MKSDFFIPDEHIQPGKVPDSKIAVEERQALVSTLLRKVDGEIKKGDLNFAMDLIRRVYEYDKRNLYARAFEERIREMINEKERSAAEKGATVKEPDPIETEAARRLKETALERDLEAKKRRVLEKEEEHLETRALEASVKEMTAKRQKELAAINTEGSKRIEEIERNMTNRINAFFESKQQEIGKQFKHRIDEIRTVTPQTSQPNTPIFTSIQHIPTGAKPTLQEAKAQQELEIQERLIAERKQVQEEMTQQMQQEHKRVQEELTEHLNNEHKKELKHEINKVRQQALSSYRSALIALMQYKIPPNVQQVIATSMRAPLSITDEEHAEIERSAQIDAYIQALRMTLTKEPSAPVDLEMLATLQQLYSISPEEHKNLIKRAKKEMGLPDETAIILVIDDDLPVLEFMTHILKQTYLTVLAADNVRTALSLIEQTIPNLIICDVGLPEIGGFTFYENIKNTMYGEALKSVPFMFASVLGDQFIINAAKELGVKTYLVKPFTRETLESTVKQMLP